MGEKLLAVSDGAPVGRVDIFIAQSAGQQLHSRGPAQVRLSFAVGGSRDRRGVAENLLEFRKDLAADFKRVETNARADGGDQLIRPFCFAGFEHPGDRGGDHAGDNSTPAGMDGGDDSAVAAAKQDRDAIGDADGNDPITITADEGIRKAIHVKISAGFDRRDRAAMDLVHP